MHNNNRKILLLTDAMGQGGAERQLSYLAMGLKARGIAVRLVSFYDVPNAYGADLELTGINTEVRLDGQSALARPRVIRSIVNEWKPNLTIAYKDGACMGACLAELLGRHFNLVVSERNTTQQLTRKEKIKFYLYRLADHIVPNSFSQQKFISANFPGLVSKTHVITNMVDTDKFCPAVARNRNAIPHIVTTARLSPQKNAQNYLRACALLRDRGVKAEFFWYGRENEHPQYVAEVKALHQALGLEDMVHFCGGVSDVADKYRESDIFCLPSSYEGFPNVLCEAMASGLPCVASDVCDNPDILRDKARLFDPNSPEEMADALQRVIEMSTEERLSEGEQNRNTIVEMCSPKQFIDSYLSLM